mgnify:CR=1 FL=1
MPLPPDRSWLPFIDRFLALVLIMGLFWLSHEIAVKDVRAETSAGLHELVGCVITLSGGLWTFLAYKAFQEDK